MAKTKNLKPEKSQDYNLEAERKRLRAAINDAIKENERKKIEYEKKHGEIKNIMLVIRQLEEEKGIIIETD